MKIAFSPQLLALGAKALNGGARFALLVLVEHFAGLAALGLLSLLLAVSGGVTFSANAESYRIYLLSPRRRVMDFVASRAFLSAMARVVLLAIVVAFATRSQHGLPVLLVALCVSEALVQDAARSFLYSGKPMQFDMVHAVPMLVSLGVLLFLGFSGGPLEGAVLISFVLWAKTIANIVFVAGIAFVPVKNNPKLEASGRMFPPFDILFISVMIAIYPAIERLVIEYSLSMDTLGRYALLSAASGASIMLFQALILQPMISNVVSGKGLKNQNHILLGIVSGIGSIIFYMVRNPLKPVLIGFTESVTIIVLVYAQLNFTKISVDSFSSKFSINYLQLALIYISIFAFSALLFWTVPVLESHKIALPAVLFLGFSFAIRTASRR